MKKLLILPILGLLFSCATSAPLSEANLQFEEDTRTVLTYSLRGLASLDNHFDDSDYGVFLDRFLAGEVTLKAVGGASPKVRVVQSAEGLTVEIANIFDQMTNEDAKMAYLTAVLGTASKLQPTTGVDTDVDLVETRFFDIVQLYDDAYQFGVLTDKGWFAAKDIVASTDALN